MEINIYFLFVPGILILLIFFILLLRPKNKKQNLKVKLIEKKPLTHDTIIFTFLLPNPKKPLGLKIG